MVKTAKNYYQNFIRLNRLLQTGILLKFSITCLMIAGIGLTNFFHLKLMFVGVVISWWLMWWGVHKQEERRINEELWQAYINSFVPVSFTGHIIGYGPVQDLQGHIIKSKTFWFFMMNEPDMLYDAPVDHCLGVFTDHRIKENKHEF